ncbi:MAG TPA: phosphoribosylamine--glycine ligase [Bacillota bacterium]|nr:phosphoribosylamine--glycine ligase [Bacillota bacterium]
MRVLVVGGGGRCHAIIHALSKSVQVDKIYAAPGNDGMRDLAELIPIKETDVDSLLRFAKESRVDLTVVGPELSLEAGIVNSFEEEGLRIFGPSKEAARIETSKSYAKNIMLKYGIPTAAYKAFTEFDQALEYAKLCEQNKSYPIVIKYDGLAAGKGVIIAQDYEMAKKALHDMLVDDMYGHSAVIIEEYLEGPEFTFMCFVDGHNVYPMVVSQDHKRAFDGDLGPNTGGMGAYSGVPVISASDEAKALEQIMKPAAKAMVLEGVPYKGVLYGGLIKTKDGIKTIEFNARFGDPEAEVVLPRLKSDIFDVFSNIIDGKSVKLDWSNDYTIGVVLASNGYPSDYKKGYPIKGLENVDGYVYHMGTKFDGKDFITNSGRVLIVVQSGATLEEARENAQRDIKQISCSSLFCRKDIGLNSLVLSK